MESIIYVGMDVHKDSYSICCYKCLFRVKRTIKFKFEQQQFTRGAPLIFSRAPKNYLCIFAQNSRIFIEPVSTKIAL